MRVALLMICDNYKARRCHLVDTPIVQYPNLNLQVHVGNDFQWVLHTHTTIHAHTCLKFATLECNNWASEVNPTL